MGLIGQISNINNWSYLFYSNCEGIFWEVYFMFYEDRKPNKGELLEIPDTFMYIVVFQISHRATNQKKNLVADVKLSHFLGAANHLSWKLM